MLGAMPPHLGRAHQEAEALGYRAAGTDHLLLAVLRAGEGPVARALAACGATYDAARRVTESWAKLDPYRSRRRPRDASSPRARTVMGVAQGLALARKEANPTDEDVLVALLFERHGPHVVLLQELGTSRSAVRQALVDRGVSIPDLPLASDPVPQTDFVDVPRERWELVVNELSRRSNSDPARFLDEHREARWSYGSAKDRQYVGIYGEPGLGVASIVEEILAGADPGDGSTDRGDRR
jgi:ATP-dependent Clp protease ATP-binding subunit ClpA